jgi:hypothetical protein
MRPTPQWEVVNSSFAFGPAESATFIPLNVETDRAGRCPMSEPNIAGLLPLRRGFEADDLSCARTHLSVLVSHGGLPHTS